MKSQSSILRKKKIQSNQFYPGSSTARRTIGSGFSMFIHPQVLYLRFEKLCVLSSLSVFIFLLFNLVFA